ncbi:hypothetical protein EIP75_10630 [Aquabacterium soli]|uniref:Uncharacterized protein n=1 Tax=Aquabacterium soli TaxID=2493092 RepID=A0A3R8T540_9BURK|nr:hypothetical protein [Aquabacterium soli]RRS04340.1 hypothetical protein EIP75_10630 [Aquabacterium soli]
MLERFGFVLLDVALKLFFFVFTYQSSMLLSRPDFDLLSYFRTTLTMCVGGLTSTVGIYYLVYSRRIASERPHAWVYRFTPAMFFILIFLMLLALLIPGARLFQIDGILRGMGAGLFFLAILVSSLAQVMLVYRKALGRLGRGRVVCALCGLLVSVVIGVELLRGFGLRGAAAYICLGYGVLLLTMWHVGSKQADDRRPPLRWRREAVLAWITVRRFLLPNFVETLFSIMAPWLAVYFMVSNAGMGGVGPLLFYQALVGLPVFMVYSLTLNGHARFDVKDQGMIRTLRLGRVGFVVFYGAIALVGGALSDELRALLKLDSVSVVSAFCLFVATILQAELVMKGMVFKKAGESRRTLRHNGVYSLALCLLSWGLTRLLGHEGYGLACLLAWLLAYLYVNWDFRRTFHMAAQALWLDVVLIAIGFACLLNHHRVPTALQVSVVLAVGFVLYTRLHRSMVRGAHEPTDP